MVGFFDFFGSKKHKCLKCKVKMVECGTIKYKKKMKKVFRCPVCGHREMEE
ncbi:MAG: hypothetical protein OH319_04290 [Candidatus Parvarchaeota archaeon]|nr:hypothetical protein [Candidatus Jingweiarchaeum tengchongense]MCW1297996.1 hypothetical protein [Candidatus Jingweiarchaeum tengchongense]MCW1300063.1 hypothetical protein [Candidatus Jingweiarchaeum tengchongense]MCW1304414.1 hypothetical protein [Candidatus Jingweiarchaeum tengchongense]MCW1305964.1 hypothetical protein [Candidatus Jingweiarchaeum tengchongense]